MNVTLSWPAPARVARMAPRTTAGILFGGDARRTGMHHQLRPVEKPSDVDADQRRWDQSEVRERRIAAADARHPEKHLTEPRLSAIC